LSTPPTFETVACDAAKAAGRLIREHFLEKKPVSVEWKGLHDFVTAVDHEAEAAVLGYLKERFPEHAVMAEEGSPDEEAVDYRWIVDPLDGTTNYIHGFPEYAVSIAAVVDKRPRVAVVAHVPRREQFHAIEGGGAWRGSTRLTVSHRDHPGDCLIGTGFPFKHPELLATYLRQFTTVLRATSGVRRAGSAALDLTHVANGHFDGFWELALAPWDLAAGTLLVREAGGLVTNLEGSEDVIAHGPLVAGTPAIHAWLLNSLR